MDAALTTTLEIPEIHVNSPFFLLVPICLSHLNDGISCFCKTQFFPKLQGLGCVLCHRSCCGFCSRTAAGAKSIGRSSDSKLDPNLSEFLVKKMLAEFMSPKSSGIVIGLSPYICARV